ncbi:amino acid adenylation domain-containing protein [Actinokineospora sp.]|uniref:amino acid adenylation domain-containing protein n=1 Tax=Actinokineospora sp. TaxID=1872133 RepID=UPI004038252B
MSTDAIKPETGDGARLLRDRLRSRADRSAPRESGIGTVPREGSLPLSFAQRRLWVLDQLRPGGTDYLVPLVLRLSGELSGIDLVGALHTLVARHEILRTRYSVDRTGEPVQLIDPPAAVPLAFDDLTGAAQAEIDALLDAETTRPLDLARGPVVRARLIRVAPREHLLTVVLHHIAVDGWSLGLLVGELADLCAGADLPAPAVQYADFAAWQRTDLVGDRLARGLGHWTRELRDLLPLELPTDRPRPAVWEPAGQTVPFTIPAEVARGVAAVARAHEATPFMVYLSAFWALLHRYSGQTDFGTGSPIAGRTHADTHELLGTFINLLVLRADLSGDPTFAEVVDRARGTAIDAYAHQDVPFERVVDAMAVDRDLSSHPLVNVNFTLQNNAPVRFQAGPVTGELVTVAASQAKFDLGWTLSEQSDGSVSGEVTFPHALLDAATARRMAEHYQRLIAAAVAEPGRRVAELPLLSEPELQRLVAQPVVATTAAPSLPDRFAETARARPDAPAVTFDGEHLGYGDLDARANRVAHRLRALGVRREDLVGLCLPRGFNMIVAILGVLKAGAAYLPLDPDHPAERLAYLTGDAQARVVLTEEAWARQVSADTVILLDDPDEIARLAALPSGAPEVDVHPDDLAYVIYTSGSTGLPKGVQVTHANVVRLLTATEREYRFGPDDVWALFHSYAFDVSVWELWGTFLFGGRLVVVPNDVTRSPWELATLLAEEGVTVLNQTPSAFQSLVELAGRGDGALDGLRLRLVILAGEAMDVGSVRPWWDRFGDTAPQVVNMYGITETTVHVTYRPVGIGDLGGDRSPIGRPMRDLTLYVLDQRMRPVPIGVPGEVYVGGPGVTRGYLGRRALTAQRFVPDPFGPPGARLYRSGDKARLLANGELAFLGRFDDQVKIRGYRIELGEVASCLATHPDLDAAVVTVNGAASRDSQLVGYVVPKDGVAVAVADLRAHVAARLPAYMVPAIFMVLPKLPLTVNGKVDHRALPKPDVSGLAQADRVAPRTPTEKSMAAVWAEVLDVDDIGVHDNFFELGGDSIRAVRLVGLLRANGMPYSVQDLFRHQSIADLSHTDADAETDAPTGTLPFALLDAADRAKVPTGVLDAYPMARVQVGMVYELLADTDRKPYHNVTSYLIRDGAAFDVTALTAAADVVVANHEILRTSFDLGTYSEPLQLVAPRAAIGFGHEDLRGMAPAEQDAHMAAFRARERERTFDLAIPPLIRVHAHEISADRWFLSVTECHAILDGWSHNSIITELLATYRTIRDDQPLPEVGGHAVRYADFIAHERRSLTQPEDRAFWAGRLGSAARLTIPAAWADPDGPGMYYIEVPFEGIEDDLRALAKLAGGSLKSVLHAAHLAVWRAVSGGERFYGGLLCNGRIEVEGGDDVRGMFLNPVPFVAPAEVGTWRELARAVFDEEVALWPHRRFPLPQLQHEFGNGGRLLEVAFNYLDFHVLDREMVDTEGSTDISPNEFPAAVIGHRDRLILVAKSRWVGRPHGELLAKMYRRALTLMAADPDGDASVSLLPPEERTRLLTEGNDTQAPSAGQAVHELVAQRAAAAPDTVAVEGAGLRLTYGQLHRRAGAIAQRLRAAGVLPGQLVAVCLPRRPELVAAILGALVAGAAYVPLDPRHPTERVTGLLHDTGARAVITDAEVAARLTDGSTTVIVTDDIEDEGVGEVASHHPHPDELVYVVHTSGSSGKPKGVMIRHGAMADRIESRQRTVRLSERDVVISVVPATTDVSQLCFFTALTTGARLVLAEDDAGRDPQSLADLLRACGASFMQASPTTWRMLAETGWTPPARFQLLSGGEGMGTDLVRRLCATDAEVWDYYGPSEVTVFCFGTRLFGDGSPPRFESAANTMTYLLDATLEPVPFGVPGQIYVGGDGLARGYLGQPGVTAGAFLPDPFATAPGARMYATGDVGRRDRHGRVEILGRQDQQLKIGGFRVELGEIENSLVTHPGVRAAVVHPQPGAAGELVLAAYVIVADEGIVEMLREFLGRTLPEYMVPTHVLRMQSFPRLANGKVDRSALPVPGPERPEIATPYRRPEGPVEEAIAAVWSEELGIDRVGRDDDFFALGGHSLLTLRILARLPREHDIDLSFRDFLTHRTVRGLATVAATAKEAREREPSLLWLGESGAGAALFCVHPGGGSAHWYRHLADVYAPERPLGAFEWPGLHQDVPVPGSLAEVAATYVAELRTAQPAGPHHILGWCGSSGIAWEMAHSLHESGAEPRLILIDPIEYPSAGDSPLAENVQVLRRAEGLLAALRENTDERRRHEIRAELLATLGKVVDDGDAALEEEAVDLEHGWERRIRAWRAMAELRLNYHFPTYPGSVDLIVCEELAAGGYLSIIGQSFDGYIDQWRGLVDGEVRVHLIPGDHRTALFPPQVSVLAAMLARVIDDFPAPRGGLSAP